MAKEKTTKGLKGFNYQSAEVDWYKKYGCHEDRIRHSAYDELYVVGDWSWNIKHENRMEYIERRMRKMILR